MLAYDGYGRDADPGIALLHGWPLNRSIWSEVARRLAASGFLVLCPDLPGFGDSPPLEAARWTVEAYADEVAAFLEARTRGAVAVAGHSFGGYVALALAERVPDRVSALGLVSSRTLADTPAARAGRLATMAKVRTQGAAALLPDLASQLLAVDAPAGLQQRADLLIRACPRDAVLAGLAAMAARPDRTAVLESFPGPVGVLHGSADQLIPVAQAPEPARRAPADRVILAGVGHMPMWERAGRTAEVVGAWARAANRP